MRAAVIAACLPAALAAGPYDGIYKQVANADCALVGADGGSVKIEEGIFYGVGTQCRMTNPVNVIDMDATLFDMQCSGEDDVWSERAMVMNTADEPGIIMVWNGYAFRYEACGTPDEIVTVDEAAAAAAADEAGADAAGGTTN